MSDVRGPSRPVGDRRSYRRGVEVEVEEDGVYRNESLVHSAAVLVGLPVDVQVANGSVYAGILKTISPKLEFGLEAVHLKRSGDGASETVESVSKEQLLHKVVFNSSEVLCLTANNVNPTELLRKQVFQTDTEISQCNGLLQGKELERWQEDSSDLTDLDNLSLNPLAPTDGWNPEEMFETNQKKFNVQTSYQEDMLEYTTELKDDNTDKFRQRAQRAEQLAREIEGETTPYNYENDGRTEEERFSAVHRPVDQQLTQSKDADTDYASSDLGSRAAQKSTEAADPQTTTDRLPTETVDVEEDLQPPADGSLSQNFQRNQAVRTGASSRQPNMPSIPEDQMTEGRYHRDKRLKEIQDFKHFSQNFNLPDTQGDEHSVTDPTGCDVVSSTLNPDAKAFTPGFSFEPKPGSPASHPPILHSPVYAPVSPQIPMGHVHPVHAVQQPHSQFVATPVIGYTHNQPVPGVPMQVSQYPPAPIPAQMRGMQRHHHIPPHMQMSHEMPSSPVMTSVPGPGQMFIGHSPPVAYSPGPPQVVPVHSHGHPQMAFMPVGTPEVQAPVILMPQQQPYHPSPYSQQMPGHPAQSPSMVPAPYMINPQGMPYNTPPPAHMHMQFQGPLHPLAAQSPGPMDHRTPHQNRHGPSPPLLPQHPSPAIPIPPSARNHYSLGPGLQGPMGP